MGMSNDEIAAMMSGETSEDDTTEETNVMEIPKDEPGFISQEEFDLAISQEDMDSLLAGFVSEDGDSNQNLIDEIQEAILDSGKLSLMQWVSLRSKLREIEELIPTIDLIIKLKSKNENKRTDR